MTWILPSHQKLVRSFTKYLTTPSRGQGRETDSYYVVEVRKELNATRIRGAMKLSLRVSQLMKQTALW